MVARDGSPNRPLVNEEHTGALEDGRIGGDGGAASLAAFEDGGESKGAANIRAAEETDLATHEFH